MYKNLYFFIRDVQKSKAEIQSDLTKIPKSLIRKKVRPDSAKPMSLK